MTIENKEFNIFFLFFFLNVSFFLTFFFVVVDSNFRFGRHAESCRRCGQSKGKVLGEPLLALLGVRGVQGGFLGLRRASGQRPQRQTNKKIKSRRELSHHLISYPSISLFFPSVDKCWSFRN